MPENEFEKKVSSEMQELRFKPSEQVWLHVEERIRKKKKRRIFVIIFLLAGLALLGYWQRNNFLGEKKDDIVKAEKEKENNPKTSEETNSSSTIDQNSITTTEKQETKNNTDKNVKDKLTDDRSAGDKKNIRSSTIEIRKPKDKNNNEISGKPVAKKNKSKQKPELSIGIVSANSQNQKPVADNNKTKVNLNANIESEVKEDDVKLTEAKPQQIKIDSAKAAITQSEELIVNANDTITKNRLLNDSAKLVKPAGKKWKWGVYVTPGISSLNDQSFSIGSNKSLDAYNYLSSAGGGAPTSSSQQKPSDVKSGFAFQVGVFAQRQISARTSLSLGLQYGYYSNIIHVGNRRDSLIGNSQFANVLDANANYVYNAGGDTIKFTNQYHFVELPILFNWQLNKNKARPFIWSMGITIGQLVASKAIMYDTAFNGIYYSNKSQLNKTQFTLSTGLSWTLANNKRAQWNLGPVANIHLNRLLDNPFENKSYLFFVGLHAGILFHPKK